MVLMFQLFRFREDRNATLNSKCFCCDCYPHFSFQFLQGGLSQGGYGFLLFFSSSSVLICPSLFFAQHPMGSVTAAFIRSLSCRHCRINRLMSLRVYSRGPSTSEAAALACLRRTAMLRSEEDASVCIRSVSMSDSVALIG